MCRALYFMKRFLLFLPLLCTACSAGSNSPESANTTATAPAQLAGTDTGQLIDKQNGFRDKQFGSPLSAFHNLQLSPWQPGGPAKVYVEAAGQEQAAFGQATVLHVRYWFVDDKFYKITLEAPGEQVDKFMAEARRVYGPGRDTGNHQFWWEGQQAVATAQESGGGFNRVLNFTTYSKSLAQKADGTTASR